jgi:hypothetical protein
MQQILQVATGYIASSALSVVMELEIPDHLSDGPKSAADLSAATGATEDGIFRTMRLLASLGLFDETGPREFGLNDAGRLLSRTDPRSLGPIARFLPDPVHFRVYANLMHSVRTGEPAADTTLGMPVFDYLAENPGYSEIFNNAMTAMSAPAAAAVVEAYDFSGFKTIIDVGGGHGEILMTILRATPESRGILTDLDHVLKNARPRIADAGLADRCETVGCDFFKAVPAGGDAYVMKHIIHDWDDDRASLILRNIGSAMGNRKGSVLLIETVVPEDSRPDMSKFIDLEMLTFPGGRERTEAEFRELFEQSGFSLVKIVPTKSAFSVVEAVRK